MTGQLERTLEYQGDRVVSPWAKFDRYAGLRPKTLVNVFSAPGVGKSMWALNLAYGVQVPVLYLTLDTPLVTQATRTWAYLTRMKIRDVERNPRRWMQKAQRVARLRHVQWVEWVDTPIAAKDVSDMCGAFVEYMGVSPRLIIVDNIREIVSEQSYNGYLDAFQTLKRVAFNHSATVVTLHHATKHNEPGDPLYLNDVEYTGDKQPDVVVGMYTQSPRIVALQFLKSRLGESAADGSLKIKLKVDFARARVHEEG